MAIPRVVSGLVARFRAQRGSKEILLAIALTLAAAAFIVAAMRSTDKQAQNHRVQSEAPYAAAGK
jgi:zinc transporter ZupT